MNTTETIENLKALSKCMKDDGSGWPQDLEDAVASAITLLSPTSCDCEVFQDAQDLRLRDRVGFHGSSWYISLGLPPISFCPWCGGKVTTAQEVKETICPGCGKPSNHMESGTTSDHWGVWHGECEKEFWMAGTGLDDRVPPFSKRNVAVKEEPC